MGQGTELETKETDPIENCTLARVLAERMRDSRDDLTHRWLDRISARVSVDPNRIFPTDALLDHVPLLILGIADYLENPQKVILSDVPVVAKAMELGELRFSQGFDEYELLKEYEIFGGILFSFLSRTADSIDEPCSRGELLACAHRLFLAVALIQQATLTHYLTLVKDRLSEREQRLRTFNRTLSHELRNLMGTIGGAADILELGSISEEQQRTMVSIIVRNTASMKVSLENLVELSRLDEDARRSRHVSLPKAAAEVARQLREAARGRSVEIRLAADLPTVDPDRATAEGGDGPLKSRRERDQVLGFCKAQTMGRDRRAGDCSRRRPIRNDSRRTRQWSGRSRGKALTPLRALFPRPRRDSGQHRGNRAWSEHRQGNRRCYGRPRVGRVFSRWLGIFLLYSNAAIRGRRAKRNRRGPVS